MMMKWLASNCISPSFIKEMNNSIVLYNKIRSSYRSRYSYYFHLLFFQMAERSASYSSGKEEEEEGGQEVYREFALPLGVAEGGGFGADKSNILLLPESASNPTCNSHSGNSNSNSNCSGSSISAQSYVNIDVSGELTSQPQTKSSVSNSASLGHVFKSFTAQPTASISSAHAFIMSEQASAASSRITRYLPKLRCKISSDLIDLNRLHDAKYTWIPSEEQVRPTPEVRQKKLERLDSINKNWLDFPDYIYHSVFGKEMVTLSGKLTIFDRNTESEIRFAPNEFPYRVAGNHFVLWFGVKVQV